MSRDFRSLPGHVWVSAQIDPASLSSLKASGFSAVVSHRPDGEEPGQPTAATIRAAAEAAGLSFAHLPVQGFPGEEAVDGTATVLADAGPDTQVLMFCRSGMRSAVTWALARRGAGDDADDLRAAAATAGYDLSHLPL